MWGRNMGKPSVFCRESDAALKNNTLTNNNKSNKASKDDRSFATLYLALGGVGIGEWVGLLQAGP